MGQTPIPTAPYAIGDKGTMNTPMNSPITNLNKVMDVSGQNVIVTGGSRGIGWGICQAFAQRGAHVAILDIDGKGGDLAAHELEQYGGKYMSVECDITNLDGVRTAVDAVHAAFGHISVLVNNAGITEVKPFLDINNDLAEWHRVIDVDLNGTVGMTHAVANKMRADKQGGLIINISSIGGARCSGARQLPMAGYVAAKAAINHLTASWAIEFAEYDIRVNTIMPGLTRSKLDEQLTPEYRAKIAQGILTRRYGEPIEIGALCVFFASAEGSQLDGVVIPHDGGFLCIN
jgi:NAD(P)-dependent dehydrogenase (short-subunit alcohol dehydrogenase family)